MGDLFLVEIGQLIKCLFHLYQCVVIASSVILHMVGILEMFEMEFATVGGYDSVSMMNSP